MTTIRALQLGSPTGMYGAERWILALVRHFDPRQVTSIVGAIRDDPGLAAPLCRYAEQLGFERWICEAPGRVNWSAVRQLRQYITSNDIHVLHTHGYKTDLIGLLATRGTTCKLITTPHGWSTRAGTMLRLYEALDRAVFPWFDAVVPLSDKLHDELAPNRYLRGRLHLITNGVDIGEIEAVSSIDQEIAAWKSDGDFVIGYIGQLIARKGLDVLLEAFARLPASNKRLAIIGEGDQRAAIEQQAARLQIGERVRFFGFRDDRLALLKGFDVFALPSRLEGIPRCLMESMAAGVPVVASDIPGCCDLVTHNETGLLFAMDDVQGLVEALQRCMQPDMRMRLARAGRELVMAQYSAAAMARKYLSLYQDVLGRSSIGTPAAGR